MVDLDLIPYLKADANTIEHTLMYFEDDMSSAESLKLQTELAILNKRIKWIEAGWGNIFNSDGSLKSDSKKKGVINE